ncbi:MAG: lipopolysaccharide biosynthesis protein [Chloroflexota bacterium]
MITLRSRMRTLSSQSLVYGLSGALTKIVGLVIVPILLRIFTPADYAVLDLVTAFTTIIGGVLLLGADSAVAYYFYRQATEENKRTLLSTWMYFQFVLNSVAGLALFLLAEPLAQMVIGPAAHGKIYLQLTAVVFPLSSSFAFGLEVLRLEMRPRRYLLLSAIQVVIGFVLTLLIVVALHKGLTGVYVTSALTNVAAFLVTIWAVGGRLLPRFSTHHLRSILSFGVPLVPISLASWAIAQSSRFFIKAHAGNADVGLYSAGNKVAQIMLLVVTAFGLAWAPFAYSIADEPDAKRTYARVLTYYVAVLGWLALALSLFAPLVLEVGKPAYLRGYQVVPFLAMSYLVNGAYYIVAMGTNLSKKTIHLSWITILAGIVTLAVNTAVLPVPYLSLIGAAFATLCGNLVLIILVYWMSQRLYHIPYNLPRVLTAVACLTLLVVVGQIARGYLQPTSPTGLLARAVLVALYPALLVGLRVIERHELATLHGAVVVQLRRARGRV